MSSSSTSVAVITADPVQSRRFYVDTPGLPLQVAEGDNYFYSESIGGSKHVGLAADRPPAAELDRRLRRGVAGPTY